MRSYNVTNIQYPGKGEKIEKLDLKETMKKLMAFTEAHPGAHIYRPYLDSSLIGINYSDRSSNTIYGIVVEEAES